jgi:hypothetical protein
MGVKGGRAESIKGIRATKPQEFFWKRARPLVPAGTRRRTSEPPRCSTSSLEWTNGLILAPSGFPVRFLMKQG